MRRLVLCLVWCFAVAARADALSDAPGGGAGGGPGIGVSVDRGITEVLQRSQAQRLAQRGAANSLSAASARLHTSFNRLLGLMPGVLPGFAGAELQLVGGDLFAEAVFGRAAVAVSEAVGDLPEGERLLLLAHELGHLGLGHWAALNSLYRQHIPGAVTPTTTDPVAAVLGAQAHALSHRQEFEADAFGFSLARQLGFGVDTALSLLLRQGLQFDSATHPATRRRLAQLRLLDTRLAHAPLMVAEGSAVAGLPQGADPR